MKKLFLLYGLSLVVNLFAQAPSNLDPELESFKKNNPYSWHIINTFLTKRTYNLMQLTDLTDLSIRLGKDIFSGDIKLHSEFNENTLTQQRGAKDELISAMASFKVMDITLDSFTKCTNLSTMGKAWCDTYINPELFKRLEYEHYQNKSK